MYAPRTVAVLLLVLGYGCTTGRGDDARDAGPFGFDATIRCSAASDSDGDGIADAVDTEFDTDGDGTPDRYDLDSDDDGVDDRTERRSDAPCAPADTDGDGIPDFRDPDSDNDGLFDREELAVGTDPLERDSDGDGVTDLGEVRGSMTDPLDPSSTIPETDFFVVLPYFGDERVRQLRFGTRIGVADVFLLVDTTSSMRGERARLVDGLLDVIVPGIQDKVADVQIGVGGLDDYPYYTHGGTHDRPFYVLREIGPVDEDIGTWSLAADRSQCPMDPAVDDIGRITGASNGRWDLLEAVEGLPCHHGGDNAESYVPALWSLVTGEGLSWPSGSIAPGSCPEILDEPAPRWGYPCFRSGALPVVLLIGDADFHNGPAGRAPYGFTAPHYPTTYLALAGAGVRVLGIWSGGTSVGRRDFERVALDTGTVAPDGTPLVFDIGGDGTGLDTRIVEAVGELVGGTPQDVSTRRENVDGNPDDFDATRFIVSIQPAGAARADGTRGYDRLDETTFYGVIPGTFVDFDVHFQNEVRPPAMTSQIFEARIVVVGNGVADLDARNVYIVVPPEGATVLI